MPASSVNRGFQDIRLTAKPPAAELHLHRLGALEIRSVSFVEIIIVWVTYRLLGDDVGRHDLGVRWLLHSHSGRIPRCFGGVGRLEPAKHSESCDNLTRKGV